MADTFTVFAKFGDVCAALNEEDRKELIYAVNMYGMFGEEVGLPYHLAPVFIALREDIDNSKESRKRGGKGGRPSRDADGLKPGVSETGKPGVSANGKPGVSEDAKPGVSTKEKPGVSTKEKPGVSENGKPGVFEKSGKTESQTKPNHTRPNQTNSEGGRANAARFTPPTVDEVARYVEENGYGIDPARFCDFYAANGWKAGRNPMRDWRAAVRNWERGDAAERKEAKADEAPVFREW